jgi:dihydrofolate reductase
MILSHIAAMGENLVIGNDGELPWDIPEDMKYFMNTTKDHVIIMGRKTFETLDKPLPKRLTIIVTRQLGYKAEGCVVVTSLKKAIEEAKKQIPPYPEEVFICGGGEIYKESLPLVNKLYLTRIQEEFDGDTFYPEVDFSQFKKISHVDREEPLPFSFEVYERI